MLKKNFYITSFSTGMIHRCVTPLYCNNSIQQKNHKVTKALSKTQSFMSLCLRGSNFLIVFERDELNNWYAYETAVAMKYFSTSDATQQAMPYQAKAGNLK